MELPLHDAAVKVFYAYTPSALRRLWQLTRRIRICDPTESNNKETGKSLFRYTYNELALAAVSARSGVPVEYLIIGLQLHGLKLLYSMNWLRDKVTITKTLWPALQRYDAEKRKIHSVLVTPWPRYVKYEQLTRTQRYYWYDGDAQLASMMPCNVRSYLERVGVDDASIAPQLAIARSLDWREVQHKHRMFIRYCIDGCGAAHTLSSCFVMHERIPASRSKIMGGKS